jgi:hypothetical protein
MNDEKKQKYISEFKRIGLDDTNINNFLKTEAKCANLLEVIVEVILIIFHKVNIQLGKYSRYADYKVCQQCISANCRKSEIKNTSSFDS